jgi:hypothetical protein
MIMDELGKLRECNNHIENGTRDNPALSIVPQPTKLHRNAIIFIKITFLFLGHLSRALFGAGAWAPEFNGEILECQIQAKFVEPFRCFNKHIM